MPDGDQVPRAQKVCVYRDAGQGDLLMLNVAIWHTKPAERKRWIAPFSIDWQRMTGVKALSSIFRSC